MGDITSDRPVAYFCAEYGLEVELPLYAGGLGVLAGDTVKEAGDQNFPMVALGLLYRGGKAVQKINMQGEQSEMDLEVDPVKLGFEHVYVPGEDQPLFVRVHLTALDVWARVWKRTVNQTTLYLLDPDTDQNQPEERGIAKALYYGSDEELIKQQMLLGIGGVKLLHTLGITPLVYHVNEGRPAFLYWQLIRYYMDKEEIDYQTASKQAKAKIVYTNHTLVREGNQSYESEVLVRYASYYASKMKIAVEELLAPGIEATTGKFNMTLFALNTSRRASSVSEPHFNLSKSLWPEFDWVNITNGVHMPTWQDREVLTADKTNDSLWYVHEKKKQSTMEKILKVTGYGYDPEDLIICWARRITGYKRLSSVFEDIDKLKELMFKTDKPITLLIAGKAHTNDTNAKQIIKRVIEFMQQELAGRAIFIPDYNIGVAQFLVSGSDVWLNTPIQGQEASGTSGMKAMANGVLQLTVQDGWTAEVDWHNLGWTLDANKVSESLYFRIEKDVVPMFYHRDRNGVPQDWLLWMKRSIELADQYSTTRMLSEYQEKLYQARFL